MKNPLISYNEKNKNYMPIPVKIMKKKRMIFYLILIDDNYNLYK
jgi:hypothetical protein